MSGTQTTLLFNRNSSGDVDDSELIENYDKQYEKVKKKAKAKLPPIGSPMSDLSLNQDESNETLTKNKPKKKLNTNQDYQAEASNCYQLFKGDVLFPPPPPPPDSIQNLPKTEREAQTSMLMSYYMSGFHAGYYLGIKKNNSEN